MTEIDLAALSGAPERAVGLCILQALGEGKLPPDVKVLESADPGSIVAREVLQRLQNTADDGILK